MKRILLLTPLLLAAAGAAAARPAPDQPPALESMPGGWHDVMPGADLKGWTRFPIPPTGQLGRMQWHVDPAAKLLICDGDGGHDWLRCDREVADGIFHVEFRFTPVEGKRGYNSGVFARNSADGAVWHQAQVGSSSGGFLFGNTMVGGTPKRFSLSSQIHDQRVRPAGEWNTYEVTTQGKRISAWVNGAATSEMPDCEVPRGYFGVEGEGWRIEFRNLKLKVLGG